VIRDAEPLPGVPPSGCLPDTAIRRLCADGAVRRPGGLDAARLQPCSLDLTLSDEAWRMPASVLPTAEPVRELIAQYGRRRVDLSKGEVLDRDKVWLVRLAESFALPPDVGAYCNNKSSVGRIDVQTRVVSDRTARYDKLRRGYAGEAWLEVIAKSFDVELAAGLSLNQAIFYAERRLLDARELRLLHAHDPLLCDATGAAIEIDRETFDDGLLLTVDLAQDPVGYVARRASRELSLRPGAANDPAEFFEPIPRPSDGKLWLQRGRFYILATRERVRIPPEFAVEMLPYETTAGEFRAHYAGFFDPGFGWSPEGRGRGAAAVLEVRPYDDDLILRDGQPICKLAFETLTAPPSRAYGAGLGSHYHDQAGPRLSRFFRTP
jgi:dCTP deaminase